MSHHTLQKLMVRMLFNEEFVEEIYAAPERVLAGLDLTEAERSQLLGVDRRAWRHDPLRRRRTLRTLVEEFKVSTTIILAETRLLASLERFFSSRFFHNSVDERGAMGLCDDAPRLPSLPEVDWQKKVYLLFSPGAAGISITNLDKSDFLVLYETKRAVEIRNLLSRLAPARARQAQDIIAEWLENGALMIE